MKSPPIRTSVVAAILQRVAEAGADARALSAELKLPDGADTEPEVVLPLSSLEQLWERAATLCRDADFGLHLAASYPRGTYGLVEFIARNSPTLRDGFHRIVRYASIMNDRVKVTPATAAPASAVRTAASAAAGRRSGSSSPRATSTPTAAATCSRARAARCCSTAVPAAAASTTAR